VTPGQRADLHHLLSVLGGTHAHPEPQRPVEHFTVRHQARDELCAVPPGRVRHLVDHRPKYADPVILARRDVLSCRNEYFTGAHIYT
jgi:hypothetical protein